MASIVPGTRKIRFRVLNPGKNITVENNYFSRAFESLTKEVNEFMETNMKIEGFRNV